MIRTSQYAPEFRVRIGGADLPEPLRRSISATRYEEGVEGASRVEVTIANERLRWMNHPLLNIDRQLSLGIRYAPEPFEEVFVGEITGVNASFPNGGMPTLTVVAHDYLQRLTRGSKDRAFMISLPCIGNFPLPDPIVASLVALPNLLIPAFDGAGAALSFLTLLMAYAIDPLEAKRMVRIQRSQTDFEFLSGLAKENGWEMYVDQTEEPHGYRLRFRFLLSDFSPDVHLEWGHSLLDFSPRFTTAGLMWAVASRVWVSAIGIELVVVLAWDDDRQTFDLQVYPGFGNLTDIVSEPVKVVEPSSPALLPKKLLGALLEILHSRVTGTGSAVGNLAIRAGRVLALSGMGDQFSGLYRITSATHTLDQSGYRTNFEGRQEPWFGIRGLTLQGKRAV